MDRSFVVNTYLTFPLAAYQLQSETFSLHGTSLMT